MEIIKDLTDVNFTKKEDSKEIFGYERTIEDIIIHHWGIDGQKVENVISYFKNENSRVSAHYVISKNEIYQLVEDSEVAWHAGTAKWNTKTIGIELRPEADEETLNSTKELIKFLKTKYGNLPILMHKEVRSTECPGRYEKYISYFNYIEKDKKEGSKMISPFEGRLTQNHADSGGYKGHKGMDIAPPKPGQTGRPVYAAFSGTWKSIYRNVKPGNTSSTWAPGRTGNGGLIANPDGEGNGYNHMRPLDKFELGDKIKAGDLIGYNDRSGNQTAPHLHFELWADWKDYNSDYDPQLAFTKFKVKPGSKPEIKETQNPSKPSGSKPSSNKQSWSNKPNGSTSFPSNYEDLVIDGKPGSLTYGAHQILMKAISPKQNKAHNKQWDGTFGKLTVTDTMEWLQYHGYYKVTPFTAKGVKKGAKLTIDGITGYWFWVEFMRILKDRGFYKGSLDGKPGPMFYKAWQSFLNSQN